LGRPARKKVYVEEKARTKAHLQAEVEMQRKKPLDVSLKEHIGKWIDNIDPLELTAVLGGTVLVNQAIWATEDLLIKAKKTRLSPTILEKAFGFTKELPRYPLLAEIVPDMNQADWGTEALIWLLSFTIAYVMIHNAHQLINVMDQGLIAVIGLFLA
jgi:hypothetical protein